MAPPGGNLFPIADSDLSITCKVSLSPAPLHRALKSSRLPRRTPPVATFLSCLFEASLKKETFDGWQPHSFPCCLSGPHCFEMLICFRTGLRGKQRGDRNQIIILSRDEQTEGADAMWPCCYCRLSPMMQQNQEAARGAAASSISLDKEPLIVKHFNDRVVESAVKPWRVTAANCSLRRLGHWC